MPEPIIQFKDVHKSFGQLHVLRGLSLDIVRGQTTVVLGPSGCGKSVLLKHAIGLLRPDSGQVFFDRLEVSAMSESELTDVRTRFGFLFQNGALFDSMTAVENVRFPLAEHRGGKMSRGEMRDEAMACLKMVGLGDFARHMPGELSGGQRKRVALARAIALRPEVVLYDEPTTGLDPVRSDVINELILRLADELDVTSLVVTHDMASAFKVGDRLVMLHEGDILADAPADEFRRLDEPRVRQFVEGKADEQDLASLRGAGRSSRQRENDR